MQLSRKQQEAKEQLDHVVALVEKHGGYDTIAPNSEGVLACVRRHPVKLVARHYRYRGIIVLDDRGEEGLTPLVVPPTGTAFFGGRVNPNNLSKELASRAF